MCFFKKRKKKKEEAARKAAELEAQKAEEAKASETVETAEEVDTTEETDATTEEVTVEEVTETEEEAEEETAEIEEETTEVVTKDEDRRGVYRVVYDKEDKLWKIKRDGAKRVIETKQTKDEAVKRVMELSGNKEVGFVVHKKDGKFQKKQNIRISNKD